MKRHIALPLTVVALAASIGLTACAGSSSPASADCVKVSSGSLSDGVKVSGDFGAKTTAAFTAPLGATGVQRTVVTKGTGVTPKSGQTVDAMVSIFSGASGDLIGQQNFQLEVASSSLPDGIRAGIDCLAVGSRSVTVLPATDLYSTTTLSSIGIGAEDSLVLVTDVVDVITSSPWTENVPNVTFDSSGKPTITLSGSTAPSGLAVKVLKQGGGPTITSGQTVNVHYMGVKWSDGSVFDQNFGSDPAALDLSQVILGFRTALIGQQVGSQILVSIPAQYAYGTGTPSDTNKLAGQDLVFLIEVNGIATSTSSK